MSAENSIDFTLGDQLHKSTKRIDSRRTAPNDQQNRMYFELRIFERKNFAATNSEEPNRDHVNRVEHALASRRISRDCTATRHRADPCTNKNFS